MNIIHSFSNTFRRFVPAVLSCVIAFAASAQTPTHDLYGLWVKRAAFGSGGSASITHSVVDEAGNVYVSGTFAGTLNFSDDLCTAVMSSSDGFTGDRNGFVIKFNSAGNYQWHVTGHGKGDAAYGMFPQFLEYGGGKVLFGLMVSKMIGEGSLPMTTTYTASAGGSPQTLTGIPTEDGKGANSHHLLSLQVIDAATGALENSIGNASDGFITGSQNMVGRIEGNNIFVIHFGHGSVYPKHQNLSWRNLSAASIFPLGAGTPTLNQPYPDQPVPDLVALKIETDGSRVRHHITLPNGKQILIHLSMQYARDGTDPTPNPDYYYPGIGVPAFYIMQYDAGFIASEALKTIAVREIDYNYPPSVSCDGNNNIYLAANFGWSRLWTNQNPISNSNTLTNYLGSGTTFTTEVQKNKTLLSKLNPGNLAVLWTTQIGGTGSHEVFFTDIKTEGDYTYLTGRFTGTAVPFGNGHTLSSESSSFDGFYAVYDNANGDCVYAVKMGGTNADSNTTLFLSDGGSNVLIGGTYNSPLLQVDPSGRLYPISSNGSASQAFVARYSTDPAQTLTMPSSFGDAPEDYGTAVHYAYPCLSIGGLDMTKLQAFPEHSVPANLALNDDGFTHILNGDGYTNLDDANHQLSGSNLIIKVNVTTPVNGAAKLIAWIDFNRNGVFDPGEASNRADVSASSNNTPVQLTFTDAVAKMRNGKTYMRIRLTTDPALDANQPAGLFFDGEVEDYMLNFNLLEVTKTAVSNNPGDNTRAVLGDTITYSITVNNPTSLSLSNITVFDPIPAHTTYVPNSASPSSGALDNSFNVGGLTTRVIKWTGQSLSQSASSVFSFKVAVTDLPQLYDINDSIISNIAYALVNSDTVASTGNNCNFAPIVADSLKAIADTASAYGGVPVNIDVLDNDKLGHCNLSNIIVGIAVPPASGGTAVFETDNTIKYTPPAGFFGEDSLTYLIQCNTTISTAKVRITVHSTHPVAITDHLYLFTCQTKTIDVLANDANVASATVTRIKDGTLGTATFAGGIMTYVNDKTSVTCSTHGGKTDTVRYRVQTASGTSEANVIVHILRIPRTVLVDSCSTAPYLLASPQYKNATYQWYKSSDGGSSWNPVAGETNVKLYVTEEARYKLKVTYNGNTVDTAPVDLVIRVKHRLHNGSYWYDTVLN